MSCEDLDRCEQKRTYSYGWQDPRGMFEDTTPALTKLYRGWKRVATWLVHAVAHVFFLFTFSVFVMMALRPNDFIYLVTHLIA